MCGIEPAVEAAVAQERPPCGKSELPRRPLDQEGVLLCGGVVCAVRAVHTIDAAEVRPSASR